MLAAVSRRAEKTSALYIIRMSRKTFFPLGGYFVEHSWIGLMFIFVRCQKNYSNLVEFTRIWSDEVNAPVQVKGWLSGVQGAGPPDMRFEGLSKKILERL
jgi:hypothetical protein